MSENKIDVSPAVKIHDKEVEIIGFDPLWDRRHVYKHVLNLNQGWQSFYGGSKNLAMLSRRLKDLGCKGYASETNGAEMHGAACPKFADCDRLLSDLYPSYKRLILESLREGASLPRHTHHIARTRNAGGQIAEREANFFLGANGVLTETYDHLNNNRIKLRTAYRVPPRHSSPRPGDFVRRAKERVCISHAGPIHKYCTRASWYGT